MLYGVENPKRRALLRMGGLIVLGTLAGRAPARSRMAGDPLEEGRTMPAQPPGKRPITLFLCGDVMTGRGIDQVLPHPNDPGLHEPYVRSALRYVELAEARNGPIEKPVGFPYIWGDTLGEFKRVSPDLRIINLETAVTSSDDRAPKGINYRWCNQRSGSQRVCLG